MKIVILDGFTSNPGDLSWDSFEALGELTVYDRTPADKIVERIGDAEAVITNKTPISRQTLEACPSVKYVGVLATGYNIVDVDAAAEKGIIVTNIPSYSTYAAGQMAIALLLEICHHVGAHSDAVHGGAWSNSVDFTFWNYPLIELAGKTMGIIGYGNIGRVTAGVATAFGMKVLANNRSGNRDFETDDIKWASFDEVIEKSDVISLHCPLFDSTRGIINKDSIARMKDGVIIINNSRGPVIVEQDLADALHSGKVYAAGIDVACQEPINADSPLLGCDNCIITPHISWVPKETRVRLLQIASSNLAAYKEGKPVNEVTPQK